MSVPLDSQDLKSILQQFPAQVQEGWGLVDDSLKFPGIERVVIAGMGGSALPGELLKSCFPSMKIPLEIHKNYTLPEYLNSKTLVFSISYSGNTEESIEALRFAYKKGCTIVAISSGGALEELSKKLANYYIKVPSGVQPRFATAYMFFPIIRILQNSKIIPDQTASVHALIDSLRKPGFEKKGAEIAKKIEGKIPIIYSSERLHGVAYKWKINFNENAKMHAFCNFFPELNHNEILGYTNLNGPYYVLILKDEMDHARIKKRMDITKKLIMKQCPVLDIEITGTSDLIKVFTSVYVGDWVAYHVAIAKGIDPSPVAIIEQLKQELAR